MTKRQLIDEIRELNPTAQEAFLDLFDEAELTEYLKHLDDARENRPLINKRVKPRVKRSAAA